MMAPALSPPTQWCILSQNCTELIPVFSLCSQFISLPSPWLPLSLLTVTAVFWLLSRCHAETTTMAPLCHSTSLPGECLFNSDMLWQWGKQCLVSQLKSFIDSICPSDFVQLGVIGNSIHFPDWRHSVSICEKLSTDGHDILKTVTEHLYLHLWVGTR